MSETVWGDYARERYDAERVSHRDPWPRHAERSRYSSDDRPSKAEAAEEER